MESCKEYCINIQYVFKRISVSINGGIDDNLNKNK